MSTNKRMGEKKLWDIHTGEYDAAVKSNAAPLYTTLQGPPNSSKEEKCVIVCHHLSKKGEVTNIHIPYKKKKGNHK